MVVSNQQSSKSPPPIASKGAIDLKVWRFETRWIGIWKSLGREINVYAWNKKIGKEDEFLASGGSEFQNRGPMTVNVRLPSESTREIRESESDQIRESRRNKIIIKFDDIIKSGMFCRPRRSDGSLERLTHPKCNSKLGKQ